MKTEQKQFIVSLLQTRIEELKISLYSKARTAAGLMYATEPDDIKELQRQIALFSK